MKYEYIIIIAINSLAALIILCNIHHLVGHYLVPSRRYTTICLTLKGAQRVATRTFYEKPHLHITWIPGLILRRENKHGQS